MESDSAYVVSILMARSLKVPFRWRAAWSRALGYIANIDFVVTHIFCEGNQLLMYWLLELLPLSVLLGGGRLSLLFLLSFMTIVL